MLSFSLKMSFIINGVQVVAQIDFISKIGLINVDSEYFPTRDSGSGV